jgi:DNA-binding Lrp family transcriptional regulator
MWSFGLHLRNFCHNSKYSSMPRELDRIDLKMLRLLQGNGRLSNAELAQLVDVSPATCHRRTQTLFEEGYIKDVRAMIVPHKVARGALVMVGVVLDRSTPESFAAFEKAVAKIKIHPRLPSGRRRFRLFPEDQGRRHRGFQADPWRPVDRATGSPADANFFRHEGSRR